MMENNIIRSKEVELNKTEMFVNRILEAHTDIYKSNIDESDKSHAKNIGQIMGVVIHIIGDEGFSNLSSSTMNIIGYRESLIKELKRINLIINYAITTGEYDLTDFTKLLKRKRRNR
ncbi:hypothetical protein ES702_01431 [subsurface metagenome]